MLNISVNELSALTLTLHCMSVKDLLSAAVKGYASAENVSVEDNEKLDVCWKAIQAFL